MYKRITISDYYQQKNNNHRFFNKELRTTRMCRVPWENLIINKNGEAYICVSPAWIPVSIGSILDYDNIFDLLNSKTALSIRSSILEGKYTYCNHELCGSFFSMIDKTDIKLSTDTVENFDRIEFPTEAHMHNLPEQIVFDFDYTCNFQCPSCRTELINYNTGEESVINQRIVDKIKSLILDQVTDKVTLRWAGGEPFISRAYLSLWQYITETKNTNIQNIIQTNGSYFKKKEDLLRKFVPYIQEIQVSFDAGNSDTYKKIRVNGNWNTLLENCQLLINIINQSGRTIKTSADFVVQLGNFKEIPEYINTATDLGFTNIRLSKLWNWGTWETDEFNRLNVSNDRHPQYQDFLNIIRQYKDNSTIKMYYWKNAL